MPLILQKEVTRQASKVLDPIYLELWGANGRHIPTQATLLPGDLILEILTYDIVGKAARYNGVATDIPTVSTSVGSHQARTAQFITGGNWTTFEITQLEAAVRNGAPAIRNLALIKQRAMRQVLEEALNPLVIFGDPTFNGFLNLPLVPITNELTDLYALAPIDLYKYFKALISDFKRVSRLTSAQIKILVPPDLMLALGDLIDNTGRTPLSMLTDPLQSLGVGLIEELNELSSTELEANGVMAPNTNKDRVMLYNPDPSTLLREYYAPRFTTPLPFPNGIHWQQSGFFGSSEVQLFTPHRIMYLDIPEYTP